MAKRCIEFNNMKNSWLQDINTNGGMLWNMIPAQMIWNLL